MYAYSFLQQPVPSLHSNALRSGFGVTTLPALGYLWR
jgi:hypothetical protein